MPKSLLIKKKWYDETSCLTVRGFYLCKIVMEGFIQLHRKMIEWEWYDDINTKVLFIHLLLKANWRNKKWRWINIHRWEYLTSLETLKNETGLSIQNIRTAFTKLELTHEVTRKSHTTFTVVKLNNYDKYQKTNTQLTNDQQTTNKRLTTTNKNNKNNNIYIWASLDLVLIELDKIINYWNNIFKENRKVTIDLKEAYKKARKSYSKEDIQVSIERYVEAKKDCEKQYRLDPLRFFKQNNWFKTYL